jgi:hypothetical protein
MVTQTDIHINDQIQFLLKNITIENDDVRRKCPQDVASRHELDVRLPSWKQPTQILRVTRLLDQMIDLSRDTQLDAIFETTQFLPQTNEYALGDFVHCFLIATVCK